MPRKSEEKIEEKNGVQPEHVDELEEEFKIEQLFGSKTRVRLLALFLDDPDRAFYVRELTRRIDAQLNSVRRELKNLIDMGIISEIEGKIIAAERDVDKKKVDKKKYYRANGSFIFFDELRSIMKKASLLNNKAIVRDLAAEGNIDLLFMTGKFVDDDSVPSDLLIVGDIDAAKLEQAIADFERRIGWEVNYTYMPKDEFVYRREVKDRFLASLMDTERIVLVDNFREEL